MSVDEISSPVLADSQPERAADAPAVRRLFSSAPRDPRYHMLEHLSSKFTHAPTPHVREPRAALILNRFTRTLTVMFATNAVSGILGVSPEQLTSKSFYECIQENCLPDAIRCLESAKANDSIAYLRFWYRDPRRPAELERIEREASHSSDEDDGGVVLEDHMEIDQPNLNSRVRYDREIPLLEEESRTSSGESSDLGQNASNVMFDNDPQLRARSNGRRSAPRRILSPPEPIEIEAVVSCTSDGLVVILRRARPIEQPPQQPYAVSPYTNGVFAAPWGLDPILPQAPERRLAFPPNQMHQVQAVAAHSRITGGPSMDSFMSSIREVAVFAWSLTGINGNIAKYGQGTPRGESVPPSGLPVWDAKARIQHVEAPNNQAYQKWHELNQRALQQTSNEAIGESSPPYTHHRQEQLLRKQYGYGSGPMGSDVPGSSARLYLGKYVGDDGRGPGYFPRISPGTHAPSMRDLVSPYSINQYRSSTGEASDDQGSAPQQQQQHKHHQQQHHQHQQQHQQHQQGARDNAFHGNRYLWY